MVRAGGGGGALVAAAGRHGTVSPSGPHAPATVGGLNTQDCNAAHITHADPYKQGYQPGRAWCLSSAATPVAGPVRWLLVRPSSPQRTSTLWDSTQELCSVPYAARDEALKTPGIVHATAHQAETRPTTARINVWCKSAQRRSVSRATATFAARAGRRCSRRTRLSKAARLASIHSATSCCREQSHERAVWSSFETVATSSEDPELTEGQQTHPHALLQMKRIRSSIALVLNARSFRR